MVRVVVFHGASRSVVLSFVLSACAFVGCERELPVVEDEANVGATQDGSSVQSSDPFVSGLANTRPEVVLDKPQDFYRIDLARSGANVRVLAIERVSSRVQPLSPTSPEYVLVARVGGKIVTAVPVRFASEGHSSALDSSGQISVHNKFQITDATTSVFLAASASLDQVELVDSAKGAVLSIAGPDLPSAKNTGSGGGATDKSTLDGLRFRYPHIKFLRQVDMPLVAPALLGRGDLVEISPAIVQTLDEQLDKLAPALVASVQTIGVAKFAPDYVVGADLGPVQGGPGFRPVGLALGPQIIVADDAAQSYLPYIIHHESGHAFDFATIDSANGTQTNGSEAFEPSLLRAAQEINQRYRLLHGFRTAWQNLHATGISANLATMYLGEQSSKLSDEKALEGGFVRSYGAYNPAEDIATYIERVSMGVGHAGHQDMCDRFLSMAVADTTSKLAVPYAKLLFLLGVGAITDAKFNSCVAAYGQHLIPRGSEIRFDAIGAVTDGLSAGFEGSNGSMPQFSVYGSGPASYKIRITVQVPKDAGSPIGLHRLDSITDENVAESETRDIVALLGAKKSDTRASHAGLLLIADATRDSAKGVIFALSLQDWMGNTTDSFYRVSFRVP